MHIFYEFVNNYLSMIVNFVCVTFGIFVQGVRLDIYLNIPLTEEGSSFELA